MKVLHIAKNIPTPKRQENDVILKLVQRMSFAEHLMIYPSERVPFPLLLFKKYRSESNLKPWTYNKLKIEPFKYWRLPIKKMAFILSRFPSRYENTNADLVHAHFLFPDGLFAWQLWKSTQLPYLVTLRSSGLELMKHCKKNSSTYRLGLEILKNACSIVVLNQAGKVFLERLGICPIHLIPHGIEADDFISKSAIEDKKGQQGVRISTIGNQLPTKNIDWVIEYVKQSTTELHLDVIGPVEIEESQAKSRNPDTNIQFYGKIPRASVLELLRKSDIFALPSSRESFGLSYLEAAASFNAVIGFEGQGPVGILSDEEMMFPQDRSSFVACMNQLIQDVSLRKQMAQMAWQRVQKLTWKSITKMYENLYKEAL